MPTADNSFTEKINRLRQLTLARYRVNSLTQSFPASEQGPRGGRTDETIRQTRALGQRKYTTQGEYQNVTTPAGTFPCC
jgi:hypothetical protein